MYAPIYTKKIDLWIIIIVQKECHAGNREKSITKKERRPFYKGSGSF
jgi:hypothetical protein